ncbi:hypothetical protein JYU19_00555 [bacterium AH-315-J21]|nr:hypothetical protein [bacterium AH-315-J21]
MKLFYRRLTITIGLCLALTATSILAAAPNTINYQGRLADNTGNPVADGAFLVKFVIYDAPAAGTVLWDAGFQNINTINGLFSYELGSNVVFPSNLFADTARWLGVTIGVDAELTPRTRITSQAFARQAVVSDTAGIAATVFDNSITGVKIVDGTIDSVDIANQGVGADNYAFNSISGAHIVNGSLSGLDIADGSINSLDIQNNSLGSGDIADNSLTANDLATNSVGASEIAPNSVGTSEVMDNTLGAIDLAANSVGASEIATNAVGASEIATNAVGAPEIATGAVGTSEILDGTIRVIDFSNAALPSVGITALTGSFTTTAYTTADSIVIVAPGPGQLMINVQGRYWIDADATSTASLTARCNLLLSTLKNTSSGAGSPDTFGNWYYTDPDNASSTNVTPAFHITRVETIGSAGTYKYFLNGRTTNVAWPVQLFPPVTATVMFFPASLPVSSAPPTNQNQSQEKSQ